MADSRINLLSSASSTASDDFFVVDGNTNGTRKLNAFSPTIGGNLAVTGTLTAGSGTFNGTVIISSNVGTIGKSGSGTGGNWRFISDDGTTRWLAGLLGGAGETSFDIYDLVNGRSLLTATAAGVLKVPQTTASTTTSTGALVIGNGTSGGLGVGGSIVLGANLVSTASDGKIQITGTGNTTGNKEISLQRSDAADSFAIGLTGSAYAGALTGLGNNEAFIYNSSASAFRIFLGTASTNRFDFTSSQFKINPTTASNSTSSGALVVSGGVGIGGSLNAGANNAANSITGGDSGSGTYILQLKDGGGNLKVNFQGNGQVQFLNTTASTSTSSGTLVVSGGVGVAGAMNVGGSMKLNYFSTAGDPTALGVVQLYATTNTTSGAGGIEWKADAGGNGYGYRTLTVFDGVSAYDLYTQVRTNSASWTNSVILKSNGNATFSGSVQTSAPSGGTAAAWKLGTVATVSPTSPNRTIEVDIGGTIYYIHAKTTNN